MELKGTCGFYQGVLGKRFGPARKYREALKRGDDRFAGEHEHEHSHTSETWTPR